MDMPLNHATFLHNIDVTGEKICGKSKNINGQITGVGRQDNTAITTNKNNKPQRRPVWCEKTAPQDERVKKLKVTD